jgi:hypothetical protein
MVSIAAFQAVDPGSIPGRRNFFSVKRLANKIFDTNLIILSSYQQQQTISMSQSS